MGGAAGRFQSKLTEREFDWGKLIFGGKYAITMQTSSVEVVFHRYGAPRGYYGRVWKRFRQELRRREFATIHEVYKYANRFGITYYTKPGKFARSSDTQVKQKQEQP